MQQYLGNMLQQNIWSIYCNNGKYIETASRAMKQQEAKSFVWRERRMLLLPEYDDDNDYDNNDDKDDNDDNNDDDDNNDWGWGW